MCVCVCACVGVCVCEDVSCESFCHKVDVRVKRVGDWRRLLCFLKNSIVIVQVCVRLFKLDLKCIYVNDVWEDKRRSDTFLRPFLDSR